MPSTFTGIEIGKSGLLAHSRSMATIGHNMNNSGVEGYSRQRAILGPRDPIYLPGLGREAAAGQLGQGVEAQSIERLRDVLLDRRIIGEAGMQTYWDQRDSYLRMVEQVYNEPTDVSLRSQLDRFWEGWQELSLHPGEQAARQAVLQRGESLIASVQNRYQRLSGIRDMLDDDIAATVSQVNDQFAQIAGLNRDIARITAQGDAPNDLMDQRDRLVGELSQRIDLQVVRSDPREFTIYSGGLHVVQGSLHRTLALRPDPKNEGYQQIIWQETGDDAQFRSGRLGSLQELRDGDLRGEIQKLDELALNFADLVNDVHRRAFGLDGATDRAFFVEHPFVASVNGNYDRDGDGVQDSTYLFRISGINQLDPAQQIGLGGVLTLPGAEAPVNIEYFPTDTVAGVLRRVNLSSAEVVARLDHGGRLTLKATPAAELLNPDFVVRHVEDSGQFLVGYAGLLAESGVAGAYDWEQPDAIFRLNPQGQFAITPQAHPSAWMQINPALASDPVRIAAAFEPGTSAVGDGSAARAIAGLRTGPVMIGSSTTLDDFFAHVVADVALRGEQAQQFRETQDLVMKELRDLRQAISGVNLDEEFANMVIVQQSFAAAARFVSQMDQMIDTVINRMGA